MLVYQSSVIFQARFPNDPDRHRQTLAEIGREISVSKERVRQIQNIALAKLRRDGFVSLDAARMGEIVTRPLVFEGDHMVLNVSCEPDGYAAVELLDDSGRPVPGYTRQDCDRITGDSVSEVVSWRGQADVSRLVGRPVQVRIVLRKARLYAFGFEHAPR